MEHQLQNQPMPITIEIATVADLKEIHRMILDFATFQKTPEKVSITHEQMVEDKDVFKALIAKQDGKSIGFATYYFGYSSWSGKLLYLDDLYIEEDQRGAGIGHLFMEELESIARKEGCKKMRWLVSKWNELAIGFYKKRGASIDSTEYTCEISV